MMSHTLYSLIDKISHVVKVCRCVVSACLCILECMHVHACMRECSVFTNFPTLLEGAGYN